MVIEEEIVMEKVDWFQKTMRFLKREISKSQDLDKIYNLYTERIYFQNKINEMKQEIDNLKEIIEFYDNQLLILEYGSMEYCQSILQCNVAEENIRENEKLIESYQNHIKIIEKIIRDKIESGNYIEII